MRASKKLLSAAAAGNPLLARPKTGFPLWREIQPSHVAPAMEAVLADTEAILNDLESRLSEVPTWDGLIVPYEQLGDDMERTWGQISHLKSVKDSEELREAHAELQPSVVALGLKIAQSPALYKAFVKMKEIHGETMTEAQMRAVEKEIHSAQLSGVGLEGVAKERFATIQQELSAISTQFTNNLMDSTKAFSEVVSDKAGVEGLPESALETAAQTARTKGHDDATAAEGPWVSIPGLKGVASERASVPLRSF